MIQLFQKFLFINGRHSQFLGPIKFRVLVLPSIIFLQLYTFLFYLFNFFILSYFISFFLTYPSKYIHTRLYECIGVYSIDKDCFADIFFRFFAIALSADFIPAFKT